MAIDKPAFAPVVRERSLHSDTFPTVGRFEIVHTVGPSIAQALSVAERVKEIGPVPFGRSLRSSSAVALAQATGAQRPLSPDDVKDEDPLTAIAVEHAAGRLDNLAVTRAAKLPRHRPALRVGGELFHVFEDPLYQTACGVGLVEGDIIGNGIKVT